MRLGQQTPGENSRNQRDRAQIEEQRKPTAQSPKSLKGRSAHLRRSFELRQSPVDQVEPDMGCSIVAVILGCGLAGQLDRFAGHLAFGSPAALGDLLHYVTVAIPGGKIHLAVDSARILTQYLLDNAHRLDELAPVHRPQKSEAADAVADGNLIGGLLLVLRLHQLLNRQAGLGEPLLNPGERQGQSGALSLQPAGQFGDKRTHQRRARPRHIRDHENQVLRVFLGDLRHLVRPVVGAVSVGPVGGDPGSNAAEILDQGQAQHDRDGPQFAQLQGGHRLVGGYETAETFRIDPSIAVRDRLQRDVIHARKPGRWAVQQARQFPAVTLGQVSLGRANLFFDQIEVVEQPFPGRRNPAVRLDRRPSADCRLQSGRLRSPPAASEAGPERVPNPICASPPGPCHAASSGRC